MLLTQCSNFSHSQKVSYVLLTQCSNFSHSQKVSYVLASLSYFRIFGLKVALAQRFVGEISKKPNF